MPPPLAPPMRCLRRRGPAWPWALPGRPAQAPSQPSRLVCRSLQPWPLRPTSRGPSRRSPSWMRRGMRRGMRRCMRVAPEAPGRRGKQWVCRGAVGRRGGGGLWRVCVMNARTQTEPYGTLADERRCPANPSTPIPLHSRAGRAHGSLRPMRGRTKCRASLGLCAPTTRSLATGASPSPPTSSAKVARTAVLRSGGTCL